MSVVDRIARRASRNGSARSSSWPGVPHGLGPDFLGVREGRLFAEEHDTVELVRRFGSPLFVTSETQLRRNVRRFRAAFESGWPDGPVDVLPAMKANTTLATRRILSDEGAGADIYSPEEMAGVLRTGVEPARVSVNGGGKSREQRAYHRAMSRILPTLEEHSEPSRPPRLEDYAATITATLRDGLAREGVPTEGVRLQVEPGRSLYGDTGIHLSRVKVVKRQSEPIPYAWVLLDTTYFFLSGGVLEHNRHPFVVANRADAPPTMTADLVGHSCFADQIVLGAHLPDVEAGDVVALLETGAYQESSASNFNALPRPATVLVNGSEAEVIRRAETIDDVYARDVVPERLGSPATTPAPRRRKPRAS